MHINHVAGKLHITNVEYNDNDIIFHWDRIENWMSPIKLNHIFDISPSDKNIEKQLPDAVQYNLLCIKSETGRATCYTKDKLAFDNNKIIFLNWKTNMQRFRKNDLGMNVFFVFRLILKDKTELNYVIGSDSEYEGKLTERPDLSYLENKDLNMIMTKQTIAGTQDFILKIVGLEWLMKRFEEEAVLETQSVRIDTMKWNEGELYLTPDEHKNNMGGSLQVKYCIVYNEKDRFSLKIPAFYDNENNRLVLGKELRETLFLVYNNVKTNYRVRLFVMGMDDGKIVCMELKHHHHIHENTQYDKSGNYAQNCIWIEEEDVSLAFTPYYAKNGFLGIFVCEQKRLFTSMAIAKVKRFGIKDKKIILDFELAKTEFDINTVSLVLRNSIDGKKYDFEYSVKNKGNNLFVNCRLDLDIIEWEQFYWDVKGTMIKDGVEYELHLKNFSKKFKAKYILKDMQYVLPDGEYLVFPYVTKSNDMAITYRMKTEQDNRAFVRKEYLALFLYFLLRPYWKSKDIWLVYEKYSITAQDNSLYFFKYCMEELPENEKKHIYYVIDKKAPDYERVKQYGDRVIQFLSLKHMIYLEAAKLLISSDTRAHSYAWHSPNSLYRYFLGGRKHVFLQHGVIYFKQCHRGLNKNSPNKTNLFIVSSDIEKQIILDNFKYKENEIAVTGLARWDALEDTAVKGEKMILVMPTWRGWLEEATVEVFQKSDYYKKYMEFLNNEKLHDFLTDNDVKMIFYIHPKFREYITAFATDCPNIEMVEFGTQPLNSLIMKCNMMITDYSSACWDVYYQGKPVLFYLFDMELYNAMTGSYIDMKNEAFGDATEDFDTLLQYMKYYVDNGFTEKQRYADMRKALLPYRDHNNCARTYYSILKRFYKKKYEKLEIDDEIFN